MHSGQHRATRHRVKERPIKQYNRQKHFVAMLRLPTHDADAEIDIYRGGGDERRLGARFDYACSSNVSLPSCMPLNFSSRRTMSLISSYMADRNESVVLNTSRIRDAIWLVMTRLAGVVDYRRRRARQTPSRATISHNVIPAA